MNKMSLFILCLSVAGCVTQEGFVQNGKGVSHNYNSISPYKIVNSTLNCRRQMDNGTCTTILNTEFLNLTKELNKRTGEDASEKLTIVVTQTKHINNSNAQKQSIGLAGLTFFMFPYCETE